MADSDFGSDLPRDHAHAVGVFALYYNRLEFVVNGLFQKYAPGGPEARGFLFAALHNHQRREFIRLVASATENREDAEDVNYAMRCFDICSENRNLVLHAAPLIEENIEALTLWKTRRQEPHMLTGYDFSLEDIRGAAKGADETESYILGLIGFLEDRSRKRPERPPEPRRLHLSRRPETETSEQTLPDSDGG